MKNSFNRTVWGFGLASFFGDFGYEMANVLLPLLAVMVAGSHAPATLGLAVGLAAGIAGLLRVLFGWISDHVTEKRFLIASGYGITAVCNALLGFATQTWHIIWSQIGAWTGSAMREPGRDAILSGLGDSPTVVKAFSIERAMDTLGALVGPLCAFFLIKFMSVRSLLFLTLIPGLCAAVTIITLASVTSGITTHASRLRIKDIAQLPSEFKNFLLTMLLFGIGNLSKTFLVLRAAQTFGIQTDAIVASSYAIEIYIFFNAVRAITEFTLSFFNRFLTKRWWILIGFGAFMVASLLLIIAGNTFTLWGLVVLMIGMSNGIISVMQRAYAADFLPEQIRSTGYGLLSMVGNLSGVISSIVVGALWTYVGAPVAFMYTATTALLALLLFGR
ncbi:MAG: MFS transporter [Candidatus Dependentiae bacterium]